MIATICFERFDNGVFVAHVDLLRSLIRTLRRADLKVNMSQGFNKHELIKLTQPLPFGVGSKEDFVSVDFVDKLDRETILKLFNENCPPYLRAKKVYIFDKNPNLSAVVTANRYFLPTDKAKDIKDKVGAIKKKCVVKYEKKKEYFEKEVSSLIYKLEVAENGIEVVSSFGQNNLRIDWLVDKFNKEYNLDIELVDVVRINQLIEKKGKLITVEEYFRSL